MLSAQAQITNVVNASISPRGKSEFQKEKVIRNQNIVSAYYGFDGKGKKSMDEAGAPYGLTRECIRQVINKFNDSASSGAISAIDTSKITQAIKLIESKSPCTTEAAQQHLSDAGFSDKDFLVEGYVSAAQVLNLPDPLFEIVKVNDKKFVLLKNNVKLCNDILSQAIKDISHNGYCEVKTLVRFVRFLLPRSEQIEFLLRVVETHPNFTWVNESKGLFYFGLHGRNRLVSRLNKIFNHFDFVTFDSLVKGMMRSWKKGEDKAFVFPPADVIKSIIEDLDGVEFTDASKETIDCQNFFNEINLRLFEFDIYTVIKNAPNREEREKSIEEKLVCSMNDKYNYSMSLNYSALILKKSRAVYGLTGYFKD